MTVDQALPFLLFAFVAAVTPGPSNIILAATGATVGIARGLPCLLGVTVGMGVMVFVVALGLGGLLLRNPLLLDVVKWSGIALLLWLSWKIATAGRAGAAAAPDIGFWQAAGLQWVNPKSWLISTSAVGAFLDAEAASALAQALWSGALFVLIALPSCFVWLAFGAVLQRWLRTERRARLFNLAMGGLLAGSILLFVW